MRNRLRAKASLVAVSALLVLGASTAGAETVAGWDFSQYRGDGSLAPFTDTLPANYSDLDPTFNAGAESAAIGTLYFDGSFGSSSTTTDFLPTAGSMNCERVPVGGSGGPEGCSAPNVDGPVRSNRDAPWATPGHTSFDAHGVLRAEGQAFQNLLAMQATNSVAVVFEADVAPDAAASWAVSFGGRVVSGGGDDGGALDCDPVGAGECSTTVTVEFSPDGSTYSSFGSVVLTAADTRYSMPLDPGASSTGYVRLGFTPGSGGELPIIDNVAIAAIPVPEPGMVLMLLAGILGLRVLPRRA
jgi:hypothetical protein